MHNANYYPSGILRDSQIDIKNQLVILHLRRLTYLRLYSRESIGLCNHLIPDFALHFQLQHEHVGWLINPAFTGAGFTLSLQPSLRANRRPEASEACWRASVLSAGLSTT